MKPLEGLVVIDTTEIMAGPQVGAFLGDMGANVIKVERPVHDSMLGTKEGNEIVYFSHNRSKRGVVLDYKTPKGLAALLKLAARCDIFLEASRPGKAEKRGYSYDVVRKDNPPIIYCAISAFGRTGPYAHKPAVDYILQGVAGIQSWTGPDGGDPVRIGAPTSDFAAAYTAIAGILLALLVREKTGKGQRVDVSLLDASLNMFPQRLVDFAMSGRRLRPMGTKHPWNHPHRTYKTKDGMINVGVQEEWRWPGFCRALGRPDLIADPRFSDNGRRVKNAVEFDTIAEPLFLEKTTREWLDLLEKEDQYCGELNFLEDVLVHPQVQANKILVDMPYPGYPKGVKLVDVAAKLSETPGGISRRPPIPGEHTAEVLREFGFSDAEVNDLTPAARPS